MNSDPPRRPVLLRASIAKLMARLYVQASPSTQAQLLQTLLRPVGPLALVAIAAGAFARLLPQTRWQAAQVTPDDAQRVDAEQIFELVRYVEQKSPELLWQLPHLVADHRLWFGTVTGTLLVLALRARKRRSQPDAGPETLPMPSPPPEK